MKHRFLPLALCLLLSGCFPDERFWWSPDGRQAAVITEGALYLVPSDGTLGDPLAGGEADKAVAPLALSWLHDGSGFVLCRDHRVTEWKDAARRIPPAEAARIERLTRDIPTRLKNAAAQPGTPSSVDKLISATDADPVATLAALLCAYQADPAGIEAVLRKLPGGAETLNKLHGDGSQFTLHELCVVRLADGRAVDAGPPLACSLLRALAQPRVSPGRNAVAWLQQGDDDTATLEAASLDRTARLTVSRAATTAFDWTPDGRSIVFATPVNGNGDTLASIQRIEVVTASGGLARPDATRNPATLGVAILPDPPRLQVLPDGRVLFASQPATLPTAGAGLRLDPRLYLLSADGSEIHAVPSAPGALPADLGLFAASPDGQLAVVVEGGTDAVALVNLTSGAVKVISPAHTGWQGQTMPAWKSSAELTFAALGADGSPEWMQWSEGGGIQPLSGKWPPKITADWLSKENDSSAKPSSK